MQLGTVVFATLCALATVLVDSVEGIVGDERVKLVVEHVVSAPCEPATTGAGFVSAGISGPIVVVRGCRHEFQYIKEPSVIILDMSAMTMPIENEKVHSCDPYREISRFEVAYRRQALAMVVVNWMKNGTFALNTGYFTKLNLPPVCMIQNSHGLRIINALESKPGLKGTIHNGDTEELLINANDVSLSVFIDGKPSQHGQIVADNYRQIAVKATKTGKRPHFSLFVTDGFGTDRFGWRCTASQPPSNWNTNTYDPDFDTKTEWEPIMVTVMHFVPPAPGKPPRVVYGRQMWVANENATTIHCFGIRNLGRIRKYGFEYFINSQGMTYREAAAYCESNGARLASVHSKAENDLIATLLLPHMRLDQQYSAYIGLNDIEQEKHFVWSDGSILDFLNWDEKHPLEKGDDYDCTVLKTFLSEGLPSKMVWQNVNCEKKRPSACKKFVGGSDTELDPLHNDRCYIFFDSVVRFDSFGAYPRPLTETNSSMCMFSSQPLSCCSSDYVNDVVVPSHLALVSKIQSNVCRQALAQLNCFPCFASQGRFMEFNVIRGVTATMCPDTCSSIYSACKGEIEFAGMDAGTMCKSYAERLTNSTHAKGIKVNVHENADEACFRVDGLPPSLEGFSYEQAENAFRFNFDEKVQVVGGDFQLWSLDATEKSEPVLSLNLLNAGSRKSVWEDDTLVLPLPPKSCVRKGTYNVFIPSLSVIDMAGNAYVGSGNLMNRLQFVAERDLHCAHGNGSLTVVWVILSLFCAAAVVGLFAMRSRSRSFGPNSTSSVRQFFDSIGDVASSFASAASQSLTNLTGSSQASHSFAPSLRSEDLDESSNYVPLETTAQRSQMNITHDSDDGEEHSNTAENYEPPSLGEDTENNIAQAALLQV